MHTEVIPDIKKATLRDVMLRNVEKGSTVSTDELMSYGLLTGDGYTHGVVNTRAERVELLDYRHDAIHHDERGRKFLAAVQGSVRSTHIHISEKHMDGLSW